METPTVRKAIFAIEGGHTGGYKETPTGDLPALVKGVADELTANLRQASAATKQLGNEMQTELLDPIVRGAVEQGVQCVENWNDRISSVRRGFMRVVGLILVDAPREIWEAGSRVGAILLAGDIEAAYRGTRHIHASVMALWDAMGESAFWRQAHRAGVEAPFGEIPSNISFKYFQTYRFERIAGQTEEVATALAHDAVREAVTQYVIVKQVHDEIRAIAKEQVLRVTPAMAEDPVTLERNLTLALHFDTPITFAPDRTLEREARDTQVATMRESVGQVLAKHGISIENDFTDVKAEAGTLVDAIRFVQENPTTRSGSAVYTQRMIDATILAFAEGIAPYAKLLSSLRRVRNVTFQEGTRETIAARLEANGLDAEFVTSLSEQELIALDILGMAGHAAEELEQLIAAMRASRAGEGVIDAVETIATLFRTTILFLQSRDPRVGRTFALLLAELADDARDGQNVMAMVRALFAMGVGMPRGARRRAGAVRQHGRFFSDWDALSPGDIIEWLTLGALPDPIGKPEAFGSHWADRIYDFKWLVGAAGIATSIVAIGSHLLPFVPDVGWGDSASFFFGAISLQLLAPLYTKLGRFPFSITPRNAAQWDEAKKAPIISIVVKLFQRAPDWAGVGFTAFGFEQDRVVEAQQFAVIGQDYPTLVSKQKHRVNIFDEQADTAEARIGVWDYFNGATWAERHILISRRNANVNEIYRTYLTVQLGPVATRMPAPWVDKMYQRHAEWSKIAFLRPAHRNPSGAFLGGNSKEPRRIRLWRGLSDFALALVPWTGETQVYTEKNAAPLLIRVDVPEKDTSMMVRRRPLQKIMDYTFTLAVGLEFQYWIMRLLGLDHMFRDVDRVIFNGGLFDPIPILGPVLKAVAQVVYLPAHHGVQFLTSPVVDNWGHHGLAMMGQIAADAYDYMAGNALGRGETAKPPSVQQIHPEYQVELTPTPIPGFPTATPSGGVELFPRLLSSARLGNQYSANYHDIADAVCSAIAPTCGTTNPPDFIAANPVIENGITFGNITVDCATTPDIYGYVWKYVQGGVEIAQGTIPESLSCP